MPALLRLLLRRTARVLARVPPIRRLLFRLPFSRFAWTIRPLFAGTELVRWRGVRLAVEVSEYEGYFRFLSGDERDLELDWLIAHCRPGVTFFDVGANQGHIALAVATACPHVRVVAFEPDAEAARRLTANLAHNADLASRVELVRRAVGAASGTARFAAAEGVNSGVGHLDAAGSLSVPVTTLEAFTAGGGPRPDVIKIDVEGAEADVLDGLGGLAGTISALSMEVHSYQDSEAARARFADRLLDRIARLPLTFRFLLDERDWLDAPPARPWPPRIHAFGARPAGPDGAPGHQS